MRDTKELIETIESEIPHARVKRLGFAEIHIDTLEEIVERLQQRQPEKVRVTTTEIKEAIVDGWCVKRNENKEQDVYLALDIFEEIRKLLKSKSFEVVEE